MNDIDLRALADQPGPEIGVANPYAAEFDQDPIHLALVTASDRARHRLATRYAGRAATLLREMLPTAARAVFSHEIDSDGDVRCYLQLIYALDGALLWHSRTFADHPQGIARTEAEAYGGPALPHIDHDTLWAIEGYAADSEYEGRNFLPRTDVRWPDGDDSKGKPHPDTLIELDVAHWLSVQPDVADTDLLNMVLAADKAADSDSNDDEIDKLRDALEAALSRWPAVTAARRNNPRA